MSFRILITGSRSWPRPADVWAGIELAIVEAAAVDVVVVHGTARGADEMASLFVKAHQGQFAREGVRLVEERHPADWDRWGRKAGFIRNTDMVSAGADLCLAFIHQRSRGATMCADLAEKAGIPVRRLT